MPSALAIGMISRSKSRSRTLHAPWYTANGVWWLIRAYLFALETIQAGVSEMPCVRTSLAILLLTAPLTCRRICTKYRTLPARTNACKLFMSSSIPVV